MGWKKTVWMKRTVREARVALPLMENSLIGSSCGGSMSSGSNTSGNFLTAPFREGYESGNLNPILQTETATGAVMVMLLLLLLLQIVVMVRRARKRTVRRYGGATGRGTTFLPMLA